MSGNSSLGKGSVILKEKESTSLRRASNEKIIRYLG